MCADFIERMEFKYHRQAQEKGCLMASAAGFDSVIADMGVLFAMQQFMPPAIPSAVESFLTLHSGKHGGKGEANSGLNTKCCCIFPENAPSAGSWLQLLDTVMEALCSIHT